MATRSALGSPQVDPDTANLLLIVEWSLVRIQEGPLASTPGNASAFFSELTRSISPFFAVRTTGAPSAGEHGNRPSLARWR